VTFQDLDLLAGRPYGYFTAGEAEATHLLSSITDPSYRLDDRGDFVIRQDEDQPLGRHVASAAAHGDANARRLQRRASFTPSPVMATISRLVFSWRSSVRAGKGSPTSRSAFTMRPKRLALGLPGSLTYSRRGWYVSGSRVRGGAYRPQGMTETGPESVDPVPPHSQCGLRRCPSRGAPHVSRPPTRPRSVGRVGGAGALAPLAAREAEEEADAGDGAGHRRPAAAPDSSYRAARSHRADSSHRAAARTG